MVITLKKVKPTFQMVQNKEKLTCGFSSTGFDADFGSLKTVQVFKVLKYKTWCIILHNLFSYLNII